MAGVLLFILGIVLGFAVSHWLFGLCLIPILATMLIPVKTTKTRRF